MRMLRAGQPPVLAEAILPMSFLRGASKVDFKTDVTPAIFFARFCRATLSHDNITNVTWRVAQLLCRLEQRSVL